MCASRRTNLIDPTRGDFIVLQLLFQQLRVAVAEWAPCEEDEEKEKMGLQASQTVQTSV